MQVDRYVEALAITLSLEVPAYTRALDGALGVKRTVASAAGTVVNLISHPLAFLVIAQLTVPMVGFTGALVAVELFAWIGEAILVWAWLRRAPAAISLVSLLANSLSLLAGLALVSLI